MIPEVAVTIPNDIETIPTFNLCELIIGEVIVGELIEVAVRKPETLTVP